MERLHSLPLVAVLCIHRAMELRRSLALVPAQILERLPIRHRLEWVIQSIRVKQESGGNYDELPGPNTEGAGTENYLVVLFYGDDGLHRVCGVEEHLL
ncbi:hypothetical protein [Burkholderia ubonensis]|uniref:hypothetical protein n=1 Tax=Burkholderia ubonensis TaxID=101571 RepID=UPI0012F9D306|nr:hypothetical protein [Burkholderia ubonensis]